MEVQCAERCLTPREGAAIFFASMSTLRIRGEQKQRIAEESRDVSEDNVARHLRRVWPEETAELGDDALRAWARYGAERGRPYDVESEYDVGRFVDLMFLFGPHFDTCEAIPWARSILADPSLTGRQRVDALMTCAMKYCADEADRDEHRTPGGRRGVA